MSPDKTHMNGLWHTFHEAENLVDGPTVEAVIGRMASDISLQLSETDPLIYAVMSGGLVLAGRLLPQLHFPLELAYLHLTRYGHDTAGGLIKWRVPPGENVRGRTVLIIDDILDEGHTLIAAIDRILELGAARVFSAVLVNKQHQRKARPGLCADFVGLELPDRFLFGSGMDYCGYWRNANGIYAIKES